MEDVQDQPIAARKTSPRLTSKERGDRIFAYLINAPSVVLILALIAYPVGVSLWTSLHRYNLRRPGEFDFIGLGNYIAILTSYDFWHSLQVTARTDFPSRIAPRHPPGRLSVPRLELRSPEATRVIAGGPTLLED